jgi:transposase
MQTLSESQLKAAALLGDGMSKADVACQIEVHVRTVSRWLEVQEFQKEVSDRKALAAAGERLNAARQVSQTGFDLAAALSALREMKLQSRLMVREAGGTLIEKALERVRDIPAESLPIKDLPQFFRVGSELVRWADEQASEELQIGELIEQLIGPESLTAQKVQIETTENIERVFAAIADSPDFTQAQKETIFQLIAGNHTHHVPNPA